MDLNTISAVARPSRRDQLPPWQTGDAFLAGGTWLFSEPQPKLTRLIDLAGLGWPPVRATAASLEIAATCTIAQLDTFAAPSGWRAAPLIGQCCRAFLASFKVWNTATVGGNLCMALPAGPMISLTAALDGVCTIWGKDGERQLPVIDFVLAPQRNALKPGELLRSIALPAEALARRAAFRQISLSPVGRSGALLIGTLSSSGGFALTVTASTPRPVKLVCDAFPSAHDLHAHIESAIAPNAYYDDLHGSPTWRRAMTLHLAEDIRAELEMAR